MEEVEDRRRIPLYTASQIEAIAANTMQFCAVLIDDDMLSGDRKIGSYIHCRDVINDLMVYVAKHDLEQPDLYELAQGLTMLRNMLAERGLVRADGDDRGLECA
jgi:hypothetical protein